MKPNYFHWLHKCSIDIIWPSEVEDVQHAVVMLMTSKCCTSVEPYNLHTYFFLLNVKLSVSYRHQTWQAGNYWLFLDITTENEGQLWIWQQFAFFRNLISIAIKCCWEGFNMLVAVFTLVPWSGLRSWEKCLQKPFRITPELWESRCAAVIQRNRF